MAHAEHWRIVAGPLAAAVAYAKDMGWQAQSLDVWQIQDEKFNVLEPMEFHALLFRVKAQINEARQSKIRCLQSCQELEQGVDWTVNQKMLKELPKERANALRALQQGAIKSSTSLKEAWCVHCGCEATLRHLIWECKLWQEDPAPDHVLALRAQWGPESLWSHGLVPRLKGVSQPFATQLTGGGAISDPDVRHATDGSPGSNQDVRCWNLRWAAIAFRVKEGNIEIVATAVGAAPCEQTVFRAEAMAALFVTRHTEGDIDITLDCLGVKKQTESHKASRKSEDLFDGLRSEQDRVNMVWIRSHLSQHEFVKEYGENQLWRWQANREVDYLVGQVANSGRDFKYEEALKQQDQDALLGGQHDPSL